MKVEEKSQIANLVGDALLTVGDVAPLIGKSPGAIRVDMHRGLFPIRPFRLGRSVRFKVSDVRRFLAGEGAAR